MDFLNMSVVGAFLLPYFFMLITCGIPLFYLEVAIGQYLSRGPVKCWRAICPLFQGMSILIFRILFVLKIVWYCPSVGNVSHRSEPNVPLGLTLQNA